MKVKILRCTDPYMWYNHLVGKEVECVCKDDSFYYTCDNERGGFLIRDCKTMRAPNEPSLPDIRDCIFCDVALPDVGQRCFIQRIDGSRLEGSTYLGRGCFSDNTVSPNLCYTDGEIFFGKADEEWEAKFKNLEAATEKAAEASRRLGEALAVTKSRRRVNLIVRWSMVLSLGASLFVDIDLPVWGPVAYTILCASAIWFLVIELTKMDKEFKDRRDGRV